MNTQRERFEAWAFKKYGRHLPTDERDECGYFDLRTDASWNAWQEAERQMIERCATPCDELDQDGNCDDYRQAARWCAERIRMMGDVE